MVWSLGAGNRHALGLGAGLDGVGAPVGILADKNFVSTVIEFEADALSDSLRHGLSGQFGRNRYPTSLDSFGIGDRVGTERWQCCCQGETNVEDMCFHSRVCDGLRITVLATKVEQ